MNSCATPQDAQVNGEKGWELVKYLILGILFGDCIRERQKSFSFGLEFQENVSA